MLNFQHEENYAENMLIGMGPGGFNVIVSDKIIILAFIFLQSNLK